jgi:hypothetical protein
MVVSNGVIQRGGPLVTATADLGLYSQVGGNWMRFVTTAAPFRWFSDGGAGTTPIMTLAASGNLSIGTDYAASKLNIFGGGLPSTAGSTLPRHGPDRIVILFTSSVHCGETRSERVARPAEAAFFTG